MTEPRQHLLPVYEDADVALYNGDATEVLRELPAESVQTCVTSPPYWGAQRDYGNEAQIGHEDTPDEFCARLMDVFNGIHRVLRPDGTLWLNMGDSYVGSGKGGGGKLMEKRAGAWEHRRGAVGWTKEPPGYRRKDLVGMPWLLANTLRRAGWTVRRDVVWDKMVPTEPTRADRPIVQHELVFLLTKGPDYTFYVPEQQMGSVWQIRPERRTPEHPATFPMELVRRCLMVSTKPGDVVIDPFMGSGTTALAARATGRHAIGIDLSASYLKLAARDLGQQSLLTGGAA